MTGLSLVAMLVTFTLLYVSTLVFKRSFLLRLTVITYLFLISSGVYFSFETYKGWPSKTKLIHGYLVYSMVVEPSADSKGAIYYWAVPDEEELNVFQRFLTYHFEMVAPRSYYLPYSKKAAGEFNNANKKIKDGFVVEIGKKEAGQGEGEDGKEGSNKKGVGKSKAQGGDLENYDVPHLNITSPDEILRKDAQNE